MLLNFFSNWIPLITVKVSKPLGWRTGVTGGFQEVMLSDWHPWPSAVSVFWSSVFTLAVVTCLSPAGLWLPVWNPPWALVLGDWAAQEGTEGTEMAPVAQHCLRAQLQRKVGLQWGGCEPAEIITTPLEFKLTFKGLRPAVEQRNVNLWKSGLGWLVGRNVKKEFMGIS